MVMATAWRQLFRWLLALGIILGIAGGLWYAHERGWLTPAYHWVHRLASKDGGGKSGNGSMDMNMPGMNMGSMDAGQSSASSGVPGHAEVMISPELQQRIGITIGRVQKAPLRMSVRTVGIVRPDETKVARVHIKTEGWVEKLFVNYTGQKLRKGDSLLGIYSPDFVSTQRDYLNARQGGRESLAEDALARLEFWDVPAEALEELRRTGKAQRILTLQSPLSGTVLEKNVLEKEYVNQQKELYVLADLSTVWVQAKVYEYELPHVEIGQPATVTLPALPEQKFAGKVVFVQPTVEEQTRTVQVRVELPNKDGLLKPGTFANIEIQHTMGEGLLVPTSAVIRAGERDIAFRAEAMNHEKMSQAQMDDASMKGMENQHTRFVPVEVKISAFTFGDRFHILEGLKAGDRVVTSANFLIDSESRLRSGGGGMAGMPGMDMSMPGMDQQKGGAEGHDHSKMKH
jgi:Cu(I)/Ag(I) efflux system membrane fusion protein